MTSSTVDLDCINNMIASLGCMEDTVYVMGTDCLECLEALETELLKDDVIKRSVRIHLGASKIVQTDLIPILIHCTDNDIYTTVIRLLVNLTLPVECYQPFNISFKDATSIIQQLQSHLMSSISSFLTTTSTSSLVTTVRDEILKTERYHVPMSRENCDHLKNCLLLLRNLLHCPDQLDAAASGITEEMYCDWQGVQHKLVWNLFVQGLDGALLLMLNSKYKEYWTEPLVQIIALLYKDQTISSVQQSLELISSTSESSGDDEESDGSKNSSTSLSSEPAKQSERTTETSDSGCFFTSSGSTEEQVFTDAPDSGQSSHDYSSEINAKLRTFSIQDSDEDISMESTSDCSSGSEAQKTIAMEFTANKSSQPKGSPDNITIETSASIVIHNKSVTADKPSSSDDNSSMVMVSQRTVKLCHKHRSSHVKISESDSSNEDIKKLKPRSHISVNWKGKTFSGKRHLGCSPSFCMEAALNNLSNWGRLKYPLWEKRNSISNILDKNSNEPSEKDIGSLLKNFTLSFLHSGFKNLVIELKKLLINGEMLIIDKSHFLWLLSYFLYFAKPLNLNFRHINEIISMDVVSYLIYENITSCEEVTMNIQLFNQVPKHLLCRSHLLVTALKEVLSTICEYSNKAVNSSDRVFFKKLCRAIAETQEGRQLPLLLHQTYHSLFHSKQYLEDLVILNHHLLSVIEKGSDDCWAPKRINIHAHLKQFATERIINNYGRVLEDFKTNSPFLNDCVFTMLHHLAGDINASELLMQPVILKTFSKILKEDLELPLFWEDLIMYILNKFSHQIENKKIKFEKDTNNMSENSFSTSEMGLSKVSTFSNSLHSDAEEADELYWWYLQFETVDNPVARISEHVMVPELEVLQRLHLKGIISNEKQKELEKMIQSEQKCLEKSSSKSNVENEMDVRNDEDVDDEITQLLRKLVQTGHHQHLTWIQDQLLEACYIKNGIEEHLTEPVAYYSYRQMLNIPLVAFNDDQRFALQDKTFLQLLEKLGFFLGDGKCFPRMPISWPPSMLYEIAARVGPIKKEKLKFQLSEQTQITTENETLFKYA